MSTAQVSGKSDWCTILKIKIPKKVPVYNRGVTTTMRHERTGATAVDLQVAFLSMEHSFRNSGCGHVSTPYMYHVSFNILALWTTSAIALRIKRNRITLIHPVTISLYPRIERF
jgi:hypothetical protein